jgi:prohibitin 1
MKKVNLKISVLTLMILLLTSCTVIRQGEIGVKRTFGRFSDKTFDGGLRFYNPFVSSFVNISVRTENLEVQLSIPSKEGLNIVAEVSILYNVVKESVPQILRTIGTGFETNMILPVFRSSVADVSARYYAKDMHTGERTAIERAIRDQMMIYLKDKGINVEAVLLKSIKLPASLSKAIEEKLEAEQQAQRMEFVLQKARQEAERKKIEATGVKDAQVILSEGLTPSILQFKSIEAFLELAKSPNSKIIISDGDLPMLAVPQIIDAVEIK